MAVEIIGVIEDICDTSRHSCGEVPSHITDDHSTSTRHVFATMVASTFGHSYRSAVPHAEPLSDGTSDIEFAGCGTVQDRVACDNILLRIAFLVEYRDTAS